MGTSGAWTGSGSAAAKGLRDNISAQGDGSSGGTPATSPGIDPSDLRDAVRLLDGRTSNKSSGPSPSRVAAGSARRRSRSGGSSGGTGGAKRSTSRSAAAAGRSIAGAVAYRAGDRATLERLGLDFDELTALNDPFEVLRRIVDMACGQPDSTIEDHERRLMAAEIAEQLVVGGTVPSDVPAETIVMLTVATMISELVLSECGDVATFSSGETTEQDIRDTAEALAARVTYSVAGVTENDFATAIENGVNELRGILGIE